MKADISRSTFRKEKHYRKVNMQQGRVQVDSDWNEQIDIQVHHDRAFLREIVGKTGTSVEEPGFKIKPDGDTYWIGPGRYYVDGILCENDCKNKKKGIRATEQPDLPEFGRNSPQIQGDSGLYIVYLDVWERHLTALDDPEIREVALGGPDTATRTKTVWQVKAHRISDPTKLMSNKDKLNRTCKGDKNQHFNCLLKSEAYSQVTGLFGFLQARAKPTKPFGVSVGMLSEGGYEGVENHLYRVEIHDGGKFGERATFKWSRDNGTVVAKVTAINNEINRIIISDAGKDNELAFAAGQWVEVTDDCHELWGLPGTLVELEDVRNEEIIFKPSTIRRGADAINGSNFQKNPKIRRWDSLGLLEVKNSSMNEGYMELEKGVEVRFGNGTYETGDYWLIPVRTATKDVEWPKKAGTNEPEERTQERIEHHYCELALLEFDRANKKLEIVSDCRNFFSPLVKIQQALPNTGIVSVELPNAEYGVISNPIRHYLRKIEAPPVIILAQVQAYKTITSTRNVKGIETEIARRKEQTPKGTKREDFRPTSFGNNCANFKPVDVNLHTFRILFEPPFAENLVQLRWWAMPAQEQKRQHVRTKFCNPNLE